MARASETYSAQIDASLAAALAGREVEWAVGEGAQSCADFMDRVRFHSVAGLLAKCGEAFEALPSGAQDAVRSEAQRQAIAEASRRPTLERVVEALSSNGLDHMLLKGARLAYSLYDDPADRARGDTDLLVQESQRDAVISVLCGLGFSHTPSRRDGLSQQTWTSAPDFGLRHDLDLHWRISNSPALESLYPENLFARAVPLTGLGNDAAGMDGVCLVMHCALNQSSHEVNGFMAEGVMVKGARRLGWTYDIHLLAETLNRDEWDELGAMAKRSGAAPIILRALEESQQHFGTSYPPGTMDALSASPRENWLTHYIENPSFGSRLHCDFRAARGPSRKFAFLRWHAFPSADKLRQRFPDRAGWPVWALSIFRLVSGPFGWMRNRAER